MAYLDGKNAVGVDVKRFLDFSHPVRDCNLVRKVGLPHGARVRAVFRVVFGRVEDVGSGRGDARTGLVARPERLGLVRVRAEVLLERLHVLSDVEDFAPQWTARLSMVRQGFLADRDQSVEFRVVRDEEEVEFGNVVERVRFVDFDLRQTRVKLDSLRSECPARTNLGTEQEVDVTRLESACTSISLSAPVGDRARTRRR